MLFLIMNAQDLVPKKVFLTSGKGMHESRLGAFENALRQAGIEKYNLVRVSSIMPPECKFVSKTEGLKEFKPGEIVFCVLSDSYTNNPEDSVSAAIATAYHNDSSIHGYVAEIKEKNSSLEKTEQKAVALAKNMLETISKSKTKMECKSIVEYSKPSSSGKWTCVICAAVFIL